MSTARGGMVLRGLERRLVFNRLRAAIGLRWEMPRLLASVVLAPGSCCLEIGSGQGWGTAGLLKYLQPRLVVASDYDRAILPVTRSQLTRQWRTTGATFCQADAKRMPFADGAFDLVLALYVLHHVAGYREALQEIARVTRPGGWCLCVDVVRVPLLPRLSSLVPPTGLIRERELASMFDDVGFRVERTGRLPAWVRLVAIREDLHS